MDTVKILKWKLMPPWTTLKCGEHRCLKNRVWKLITPPEMNPFKEFVCNSHFPKDDEHYSHIQIMS